jgi:hypothetical protein
VARNRTARRHRTAVLLAFGLTAVTAAAADVPSAAGAIDQDLELSAAAGPPGTRITISSASCASTADAEAYLQALFIVGTAPNQQLAGVGSNIDGSAVVTVPDWVDPDQPAVIEAHCSLYDPETGADSSLTYDPVPFDVEPGSGPPVQVRTFSRTELLAGQGFVVSGSCGPGFGGGMAASVVLEGQDQSGRDLFPGVGEAVAETAADGSFEMDVIVSNANVYIASGGAGSTIADLSTSEEPLQVEPGAYTVLTYCFDRSSPSSLVLEPEPLTITGSAPTGAIDLTGAPGASDEVVIAGECAGEVTGSLHGLSLADLNDMFESSAGADPLAGRRPLLAPRAAGRTTGDGGLRIGAGQAFRSGSSRLVASEEPADFSATPDADGAWRHQDAVAFDQGVVIGQATCGDPFGDGFVFDPQGVVVDVVEVPSTTVPQLVPPTVPATPAAPASARPGTPTYAG